MIQNLEALVLSNCVLTHTRGEPCSMTDLLYHFNLLMCSTPPKWGHTLYIPCMYNTYELWTPVQSGTHTHTQYTVLVCTINKNSGHQCKAWMCTTNGKCGLQSKVRKQFIYYTDSGGNKDKNNDDDQGVDIYIPAWMFRKSNQKTEKSALKKGDSKKKQAQPKENDDRVRRNMKVKEGATKEECVADQL